MVQTFVAELPEIAAVVTRGIRQVLPVYLAIPEDRHRSAVQRQLQMRLSAMGDRQALGPAALAASSELAATRAAEGIPIDALIAAHQAGDREIWQLIVDHSSPEVARLMPELGRMMFAATSTTTEVMARAHSRVARDIDAGRITLSHQFLELLADPGAEAQAAAAAGRLGLDPTGEFVGFLWAPEEVDPAASYEAAASLRTESSDLVVRAVGERRFEMVAQAQDAEALVTRIADWLRGGRLGIGLPRPGMSGAAASIADAALALEATNPKRPLVRFGEQWLEALVLAESGRIEELTATAVAVARSQRHLAGTVEAFAAADMSIAATAAAVHLHANSVTYRLGRWGVLTGFDPRTFAGLAQSLIACRLADRES
jgi:hypothetical protein